MMTKLTFYGGVGEIGGNKILLQDEDTKIFLDFGKNYGKEKLYYDEPYLKPRDEKHLLALGILPRYKGLYKKDENETDINAIVLSHPHGDHTDYIRFVKDNIPIYCGETTKNIIVSREFSGTTAPSADYYIANLTQKKGEEVFKKFVTFRTGDKKDIGSIEIEPIHVDHSVPGAYGFIVHTSEGAIIYTGDFRLHGPRHRMSDEFIQKAKEIKPIGLIIEGTNIVEAKISSEKEVKNKIGYIISNTSKLVMAGFSLVDIDRLRTFYEIAKENKRSLALSMKQAFLVHKLQSDKNLSIFDLNDPIVLIFQREKKRLYEWEKIIINKYSNIVEAKDIKKIQQKTILVASFFDMNETVDIQPEPGSSYILSQSEPFNEEMEIDFAKLINWLEHYGIPQYHAHASGHATPHQLKQTISQISPKNLYLVHTEKPMLYKRYLRDLSIGNVISPDLGVEYIIK